MNETARPAVVFCGHGTRHADGAAQFTAVVERVRQRLSGWQVSHGFLELSAPLLPEALERLAVQGCRRIVVVPCMLFAAGHAKSDIPQLLAAFSRRHPEIELIYGRTFGVDPALLNAAADRITEAAGPPPHVRSLLLVVGRGSSDPDANADLAKIMRLLWEGLGFGWGELGYFDVTFPHLELAIDHAAGSGYQRIVVMPYLLFTGVLVRRLQATLTAARQRHPGLTFIEASSLNDHPGVVETFAARAAGALTGDSAMNCLTCRTHRDILAFERLAGHDNDHGEDHGHDDQAHDHGHSHGHDEDHDHHHGHHHGTVHPFADHDQGPLSPRRWPADPSA